MTASNLQTIIIVAIGIVLLILILLNEKEYRKRLMKYWNRTCTGSEWRKQFPQATKDSIRDFLECFVNGFAFSSTKRLKFSPDDRIMDVYRALYPSKEMPDALELETYSILFEKKYRIDLASVFTDNMTLGQLFNITMEKSRNNSSL